MSTRDIIEVVLRFMELLISWPVAAIFIGWLLRKELRLVLTNLALRLKKAEIAGTTFEFAEAAAVRETVERTVSELRNDPHELASTLQEQIRKIPATSPVVPARPLAGRHVLWVDDRPTNNVYETIMLESLGARVQNVMSTDEARRAFSTRQWDLMISDVHRIEDNREVPDAGLTLLAEIKKHHPKLPVILYSGRSRF